MYPIKDRVSPMNHMIIKFNASASPLDERSVNKMQKDDTILYDNFQ